MNGETLGVTISRGDLDGGATVYEVVDVMAQMLMAMGYAESCIGDAMLDKGESYERSRETDNI